MDNSDSNDLRSALCLFGGLALVIAGTGLLISHPVVKRYLGQMGLSDLAQAAVPDIERYLKLRSM
jgi:hypothetical protein